MVKARNFACGISFQQAITGESSNNVKDDISVKKNFQPGNKCNHNKKFLRYPIFPVDKKRRPHVIEELKRRIVQAIDNPLLFKNFVSFFRHENKRKRRTDGLESLVCGTLMCLVQDLNLHNLQYGQYQYNTNSFMNYNYGRIESSTGFSKIRIKRAMGVLKSLGIVSVTPVAKTLNDGAVINDKTIIVLSVDLFKYFDLYLEYLHDSQKICSKYYDRKMKIENKMYKLCSSNELKIKKNTILDLKKLTKNFKVKNTYDVDIYKKKEVISIGLDLLKCGAVSNMKEAFDLINKRRFIIKSPPS